MARLDAARRDNRAAAFCRASAPAPTVSWTPELYSSLDRLDGSNEENLGEQPDVEVPMSPDDWLTERDPQLEKAIELLSAPSESKAPEEVEP